MSTLDDLLTEVFDGKRPSLYRDFEAWMRSSRRFQAFAASYRTKTLGFSSAGEFLRQHQRLSGLVLRHAGTVWPNPLSRHRVPVHIVNALKRVVALGDAPASP